MYPCLQDEDDYETSSGSVRSGSGDAASCDIGLLERLIRSHPIWFLPGIQRAGAFHLLQGKDDGVSEMSILFPNFVIVAVDCYRLVFYDCNLKIIEIIVAICV